MAEDQISIYDAIRRNLEAEARKAQAAAADFGKRIGVYDPDEMTREVERRSRRTSSGVRGLPVGTRGMVEAEATDRAMSGKAGVDAPSRDDLMRTVELDDRTVEMGDRTVEMDDRTNKAGSKAQAMTDRTDRALSGMSGLDAPNRADLARTVPSVRAADLAPDSAAVRDAMKDLDEEARRVFAKAGTLREGMEALRKSPTARMARKALGPVGAVLGAGAIAKAYQSVKGGAPVSDLLVEVVPFFEAVQSQRGPNIDSPEALERIRQQQRVAALAEDPRGASDLSFQNTDLTFESSPDSGIVPTGTPVKKTTTGQRPSAFPMPRRPNVLVRGAKGGAVETLNNDLQMLGFSKGTLAGPANEFTEQTRQAVMRLQRDAGITVDGKVGPQTRAAIADMLTDPDRMSAKDSLRVDAGGDLRARLEARKQKEEPTESRSAALDILEATVK